MKTDRRQFLGLVGVSVTGGALAGCQDGDDATQDRPLLDPEPNYRGWFDGVSNYEGTLDYRDAEQISVSVGVQGGIGYYKFGPPAIAVSPGTTVVWEWTGRGGAHNVVADQGRFDSGDPIDADDETFSYTFEQPAVYRYLCTPHQSQGMRGAVFVALAQTE